MMDYVTNYDYPKCPHCGHVDPLEAPDSIDEPDREVECVRCGKLYEVEYDITVSCDCYAIDVDEDDEDESDD